MKHLTKAQSEKRHAKRRALERYGETLNRHDLAEVVKLIQSGDPTKAKFILRQTQRKSIFDVTFKGKLMRVVYDRLRKVPITFLSPSMDPRDIHPFFGGDHETLENF